MITLLPSLDALLPSLDALLSHFAGTVTSRALYELPNPKVGSDNKQKRKLSGFKIGGDIVCSKKDVLYSILTYRTDEISF